MASQSDVQEVEAGTAKPKRRFDERDFAYLAEYVIETREKRKQDRSDRERQWAEIDRQIAMEPDIAWKHVTKEGKRVVDANKAWMAELELPLQAQALEVLTADARRLQFPTSGLPFRAHGAMTDDYLGKTDYQSLVLGDENEVPSQINQDNCDKLIEGFLHHVHGQVDFPTRIDRINAEAFKYGMGLARGRLETKKTYIHEARGVATEQQRIPVMVPCSIKNHYLDEPLPSIHTAQMLAPAHIACDNIKLENLVVAATKGSEDPNNPDGGWRPEGLKSLVADKNGYVELLEMEGDIVVPRKTVRSMVIPGAIVTVAVGGVGSDSKVTRSVIRFRFRKTPFSSYLLFPYHYEGAQDTYPVGPLMKGRPVQMAATHAINRWMDSAMLKVQPPIRYDRNDPYMAANGGAPIYPGAQWSSVDGVEAYTEIGGEPGAMANSFLQLVSLYAELTGVLPARLGAQTVSHTTAFSKNAELQRGAVRTVDYTDQCKAPLTRWLDMAYQMGRDAIGSKQISFYIDAYGGFVKVGKEHLPEQAVFEWIGAGGPDDENALTAKRMGSLQLALKMDQLAVAMGREPTVDVQAAIKEVLREGKWTDIDAITGASGSPVPAAPAPGVSGIPGIGPGPAVASIQNLAAGIG